MNELRKGWFYSPEKDGEGNGSEDGESEKPAGKKEEAPLEWDTFHGSLPEKAQKLIAGHESGLKTALETERDARDTAEKGLRAVAKDLEDGSKAQKEVLRLADDNAAINVKADFYEDAHKAGVSNLKLAYLVAKDDDLFDNRGNVNFEKMKEANPELFGKKKVPEGSGGEGTGGALPGKKKDMNAAIRKMAGQRS